MCGGHMKNYNVVFVEGNLAQDPQLKKTTNGNSVCYFPIAVNDGKKGASFIRVEVWNKLAELCASSLKKGDRITALGRFKQERWEDSSGKTRSMIKLVASNIVKNLLLATK